MSVYNILKYAYLLHYLKKWQIVSSLCEWQSYLYQRISCSLIAKSDARFVFVEHTKVDSKIENELKSFA